MVEADGRLSEVNHRFCEMVGYTADEIIGGEPPLPFWPEDEHERMIEAFIAALRGRGRHFELTMMRRDGERFPVTIDVSAVESDGRDGSRSLLCVVRDVSRERRESEILREAQAVARLASFELDPATNLMEFSRELLDLAGVEVEEPTLDALLTFVPEPHGQRVAGALHRLATGGEEVLLECPVRLPNPEISWIEVRARPAERGRGVRGTAQDITQRKLAQLAQQRSEERLRQAQRTAQIGSFEIDYRSGRALWSSELSRLFGWEEKPEGENLEEVRERLPQGDRERVTALAKAVLSDGVPRRIEHRYMRGTEIHWADTRLEPLGSHGVRGTMQEITDRKRAEQEIHLQAQLLDAVHVAVVATDMASAVTHWNTGAERIFGWSARQAMGRQVTELIVGPQDRASADAITGAVGIAGQFEGELDCRRKDGSRFPAYMRLTRYDDPDGRPAGLGGVAVDVSERVESERQLRAARDYLRAVTDSIAEGLCTVDEEGRLIYMNRAAEALLGWRQHELIGKVMHDLVHYRRADGSPRPVEECELRISRREGRVARIDDDVFIRKDGRELPVEITAAPLETAEGAQGSVVVFSDISSRKAEEQRMRKEVADLSMVARIRAALAEERFVLHAQPIVDLASGRTVQHELLIRMFEVDGRVVQPCEFLPAAERHGLIVDIDRWVAGQAIGLAAKGHPVELNLSAHSISAPGLLVDFREELGRTGADPSLIVVELTETALVDDEQAAELFIERMRALGCKLALDDFGTGYGGFSYLKRLPVNYLKIDMEFVHDLPVNEASQHVVKAVVSLARGFGQATVAEGVEDERTLDLLRDFGVDHAQGYAIARPRPVGEVLG